MPEVGYEHKYIRVRVTKEEKAQAKRVANYYKLTEDALIRALIKRESIKIADKLTKKT